MKSLNKRQLLLLHAALLETSGGASGVRDDSLLESALGSPFQTFAGQELYPTVLEKATRLGFGLIKNHPFVDGNKRIGAHAMLVLLALNGIALSYEDEELISTILAVADGTLDADGLLRWVQDHVE
jgi:death-on-curing protein